MPDVRLPRLSPSIPEPEDVELRRSSFSRPTVGLANLAQALRARESVDFGTTLYDRAIRATLAQQDVWVEPQLVSGVMLELEAGLPLAAAQALAQAKSAALGITTGAADLEAAKDQIWGIEEDTRGLSAPKLAAKIGSRALGVLALGPASVAEAMKAGYEEAKEGSPEGTAAADIGAAVVGFLKAPFVGVARAAKKIWSGDRLVMPSEALTDVVRSSTSAKDFRLPYGVGSLLDFVLDPTLPFGFGTTTRSVSALSKAAAIKLPFITGKTAEEITEKAGTAAIRNLRRESWVNLIRRSEIGKEAAETIAKAENKDVSELLDVLLPAKVAEEVDAQGPVTLAELLRARGAKGAQELLEEHGQGQIWTDFISQLSRRELAGLGGVQGGIKYAGRTLLPSYVFAPAKQVYQQATRELPIISEVFRFGRLVKTRLSANAAIAESMRSRGLLVDPVAIHAFQGSLQFARARGRNFLHEATEALRDTGWFDLSKEQREQIYRAMVEHQAELPEWVSIAKAVMRGNMREGIEVDPLDLIDALRGEGDATITNSIKERYGEWVIDRFRRSFAREGTNNVAEALNRVFAEPSLPPELLGWVQKMAAYWDDVHELAKKYGLTIPYRADFTWPRALSEVRRAAIRDTEEVAEAAKRYARPGLLSLKRRRWEGPLADDIFEQDPDKLIELYLSKLSRDVSNVEFSRALSQAYDSTGQSLAMLPDEILLRLRPVIKEWKQAALNLARRYASEIPELLEREQEAARKVASYGAFRGKQGQALLSDARRAYREIRADLDKRLEEMWKTALQFHAIPEIGTASQPRMSFTESLQVLDDIAQLRAATEEVPQAIDTKAIKERLDDLVAQMSRVDPFEAARTRLINRTISHFAERSSDLARIAELAMRYQAVVSKNKTIRDWAKRAMTTITGAYRNEDVLEVANRKFAEAVAQLGDVVDEEAAQALRNLSPYISDFERFTQGLAEVYQHLTAAGFGKTKDVREARKALDDLGRSLEKLSGVTDALQQIPSERVADVAELGIRLAKLANAVSAGLEREIATIARQDPAEALALLVEGMTSVRLADIVSSSFLRRAFPQVFTEGDSALQGIPAELRNILKQFTQDPQDSARLAEEFGRIHDEFMELRQRQAMQQLAKEWAATESAAIGPTRAGVAEYVTQLRSHVDAISRGEISSSSLEHIRDIWQSSGGYEALEFAEERGRGARQRLAERIIEHAMANQDTVAALRSLIADVQQAAAHDFSSAKAQVLEAADALPVREWSNLRDLRLLEAEKAAAKKLSQSVFRGSDQEAQRLVATIAVADGLQTRSLEHLIARLNQPGQSIIEPAPLRELIALAKESPNEAHKAVADKLQEILDALPLYEHATEEGARTMTATKIALGSGKLVDVDEFLELTATRLSEARRIVPELRDAYVRRYSEDIYTAEYMMARAQSLIDSAIVPAEHFRRAPLGLISVARSADPADLAARAAEIADDPAAAADLVRSYLDVMRGLLPSSLPNAAQSAKNAAEIAELAQEVIDAQRRGLAAALKLTAEDLPAKPSELIRKTIRPLLGEQLEEMPAAKVPLEGLAGIGMAARFAAFAESIKTKRAAAIVLGTIKSRSQFEAFRDYVARVDPHSLPLLREIDQVANRVAGELGADIRRDLELGYLRAGKTLEALADIYTEFVGPQIMETISAVDREELVKLQLALVDRVLAQSFDEAVAANLAGAARKDLRRLLSERAPTPLDRKRLLSAFLDRAGFSRAIEASSRLGYLAPLEGAGVPVPPEWRYTIVPQWVTKAIRLYYEPLQTTQTVLDKLMQFWKITKIGFRPGFHIRNFISNVWLLSASGHWRRPDQLVGDIMEVIAGNLSEREIAAAQKIGLLSVKSQAGSLRALRLWDTPYGSFTAAEIASTGIAPEGILAKLSKPGLYVGAHVENIARLAILKRMLKEHAGQKFDDKLMQRITTEVSRVLMDPTLLTRYERQLRRYVIPFYTWFRHNFGYQLYLFSRRPFLYWQIVSFPTRFTSEHDLPSLGKHPYEMLPIRIGDRFVYLDLPPVDFVNISQATSALLGSTVAQKQFASGEGLTDLRRAVGDMIAGPIIASASMLANYDIFRGEKLTPQQRKEWLMRQFVPEGGTLLSLRSGGNRLWGWLFGLRTESTDAAESREAYRRLALAKAAVAEAKTRGLYEPSPTPGRPRYGIELLPTAPQLYGWRAEQIDKWWRSVFNPEAEERRDILQQLLGSSSGVRRRSPVTERQFYRSQLSSLITE